MAIRWSALAVSQSLDEMETILNEAEKVLKQLEAKATETARLPNLAGYISEPLRVFACEIKERMEKYHTRIDTMRGYLPKDALAKERRRHELL